MTAKKTSAKKTTAGSARAHREPQAQSAPVPAAEPAAQPEASVEAKEGDLVAIRPCRPMSRHKSWLLVRVVERARAE